MIIAVDIGNTNISAAVFDKTDSPVFVKTYPDNLFHSADEFFRAFGLLGENFDGAVLCSVVPSLTREVKTALEKLCGKCVVVDSEFNDGLVLSGYDRKKLGNDRVADMIAAKTLYCAPAVVFDMGTATTVSVIDKNGAFAGGLIMPGVVMSVNALSSGTALLPGIRPFAPTSFLGHDTVSCINNGVLYSQASSIEGIISRAEEIFNESVTAVVTGGAAKLVLPLCSKRVIYDEYLLLKGLYILYNSENAENSNE